jgi:RHS repeat-associated protein
VTTRYATDSLRLQAVSGALAQVLEEVRAGQTTRYLAGIGVETDGEWTYQLADGLGSVRQMADAAGQIVLARGYTPFGLVRYAVGTAAGTLGFAGEQHDAAAGLVYLRARYYDPATGRFLTRDVFPALATVPQSLHRYAYCGDDPINRTDPSGQWWWDDVERWGRRTWNRLTRPFNRVSWWLENTAEDTERKVQNWRYNPRRETARVLSTTGKAITDASKKANGFSDRKVNELRTDVRQTTAAWERGDKEAAVGHGAVYLLHFSGLTDVRLTRNIIMGEVVRVHESVQQFNYHRSIVLDPRQRGTERWRRSMGEMSFTGFDLATRGAASDVRYGLQEGDYLRAAAGAAQIFPVSEELRMAGDALDLAVAGREVYHGIESGDWAQVELGAFMAAVNMRQMSSGGLGDVASQLERPVLHIRPSHLAGDVIEKAVGSIVPGGDLALRGGREIAGVGWNLGRRMAAAGWESSAGVRQAASDVWARGRQRAAQAWESINDQRLYAVHPATQRWFNGDDAAEAARRVDVNGPRLLPPGEHAPLTNRPDRLLLPGELTSLADRPERLLGAGTVVEFGSGLKLENARKLVEIYPGARVLLTEQADLEPLIRLTGAYDKAVATGAEVRWDYHQLPREGVRATASIAIAPYPGYDLWTGQCIEATRTAHTMADITVPGGRIYVAAREAGTARAMAAVFSHRFSIPLAPTPVPRAQVPYVSEYLEDPVHLIDFRVPWSP